MNGGYELVDLGGSALGLQIRGGGPRACPPGGAIDATDVVFAAPDRVGSRGGSALRLAVDAAPHFLGEFEGTLLVGGPGWLRAYGANDTQLAQVIGEAGWTSAYFAQMSGGLPLDRLVVANGDLKIRSFDGNAFTELAGAPRPRVLVVEPTTNRLLACGFDRSNDGGPGGIAADASQCFASAVGDPTTWNDEEYFRLRAGDSEQIMAAGVVGNRVVIFKESAFFTLTGTSVNNVGAPIFHRQTVQGVGCAGLHAACSGRDAIYFLGPDGIYATQGGPAQLLTDAVEPFFRGGASGFWRHGRVDYARADEARLTQFGDVLYAALPVKGHRDGWKTVTLVHHLREGWWTVYSWPARSIAVVEGELLFGAEPSSAIAAVWRASGDVHDYVVSAALEDWTALQASVRLGWQDFGMRDVKTVRETKGWGTGTVEVGLLRDFRLQADRSGTWEFIAGTDVWGGGTTDQQWAQGATPNDLWGPVSFERGKVVRKAIRGTEIAIEMSGAAPWSVQRAQHHLLSMHPSNTTETD